MSKYICEECEEIFDEDEIVKEREYVSEFWGSPSYINYNCCPYCLSSDIREYYPKDKDEDEE